MDNIKVYKYESKFDSILISWLELYNMNTILIKDLPALGYIAFHLDTPIAAGFLRRCEGKHLAMFDSLIADPRIDKDLRSKCIDKVVENIIDEAKKQDLTNILAFSYNKNTLLRAERYGFKKQNFTLISLNLND